MMAGFPVTLTIRSRQALDGEAVRLEQQAAGTLTPRGDGWQLRYQEPSGQGETCLTLAAEGAVLERRGDFALRLRFQAGTVCPGRMGTPCGELELAVETAYLGYALSESGGRVMVRYHLTAGGQDMGRFSLQLLVRPVKR